MSQEVMMIPLHRLVVAETNARPLGPGEIDSLVASIRALGQLVPLLVTENEDGTYGVVDGQRRLTALREVGMPMAECILYQGDKAAEIGVAINLVRQDLNTRDVALTAGRIMTRLGLKLDDVSIMATVKKGAEKLRKIPELAEAAVACATPIDQFITYGALSTLEPEWWKKFDDGRATLGVLGLALQFSPEERRQAIEKAGDGWIDNRHLWALREQKSGNINMAAALFRKMSGIEQSSDLFGLTGSITVASVKVFFERQEAAVRELIDHFKTKLDISELGFTYGQPWSQHHDRPVLVEKKDLADPYEAIFPSYRSAEDHELTRFMIEPGSGKVYAMLRERRKPGQAGDAGPERVTKKQLEMLDAWLAGKFASEVYKAPQAMLRLAAAAMADFHVAARMEEGFNSGTTGSYARPLARIERASALTSFAATGGSLNGNLALSLASRLNGRARDNPYGWTLGVRLLLWSYRISPEGAMGCDPKFLVQMPKAWLEEKASRLGIFGSTRAKLVSAIAGNLGDEWFPDWLAGFRPTEFKSEYLSPDTEDPDDTVDPAAQPDVPAAHAGDTPGGPAAEADAPVADEDDGFFDE